MTRGWVAGLAAALLATTAVLVPSIPAAAASGPDGQSVTVSQSTGLDPAGQSVTVSGSGFDTSKGIYVALCVDNGPGSAPSPCVGGVDMEGAGGSSAWISSNPPSYGEGLAVPFTESGGRGSFSASLSVAASDPFVDCLDPAQAPNGCVIGTRADHTRAGDRSADVRIPVTFATGGAGGAGGSASSEGAASAADDADQADTDAAGTAEDGSLASTGATVGIAVGVAVVLLALGALGVYLRRRSSTDASDV
ncbi:hypothetical protein V2J52_13375 [Georgenia sp. MJ173]|uniref:hypothetical protein n=1 Tax=Georgenia sunbinii TaxID=3117728 RepID=UPI002F26B596